MKQSQAIREKLSSERIRDIFLASGIGHLSFFGSYARDEATEESDLDLLIELSSGNTLTIGTLESLQDLLKKELSVKKVDFVTRRKINPYLQSSIERDLVTVF